MFNIICAVDKSTKGIGINNRLIHKSKVDMNFFRKMTIGNIVIMGKNTFLSIIGYITSNKSNIKDIGKDIEKDGRNIKALPNRYNIVISNDIDFINKYQFIDQSNPSDQPNSMDNIIICSSLKQSLDECKRIIHKNDKCIDIYIIGGSMLYEEAILHPDCKRLYITECEIKHTIDTNIVNMDTIITPDKFFPTIPCNFMLTSVSDTINDNGVDVTFKIYDRKWLIMN
jgi:dihydrofolate reductase